MIQLHLSQNNTTLSKTHPVHSRISPWLSPLIYSVGQRLVLPLYFGGMQVIGQENVPKTGPVILAPTHRSRWDAVIIAFTAGRLSTGRELRFMASANEMKGIQGWFIRRLGGFPVDPDCPGIKSLRHSFELLLKGETLVIFPEGGIFRQKEVQPLKPGLARIALQVQSMQPESGIKIVPISVRYSQTIPTRGCKITVEMGKAMEVAEYHQGNNKKDAQKLIHDLKVALQDLGVGG
jgi:1-acyl-sn-glycerol-3-phosphate acyltransferase